MKRWLNHFVIALRFFFAALLLNVAPQLAAETTTSPLVVKACARDCPSMKRIPSHIGERGPRQSLYVSEHPITFAQWQHCVARRGCGGYRPDRQGLRADHPVVNVSYHDAMAYVDWLSTFAGERYRLVFEDEWPRVALGGRTSAFAWGDTVDRNRANCLDCGSKWDGVSVSPVGSFPANDFGLFDTMGNVAHWVAVRGVAHVAVETLNTSASSPALGYCKGKRGYAAIVNASWAEPAVFMNAKDFTCFPKVLRDDTIGFRVALER
jgi:formylglycine-generating enzyme required for sulfatase activity